MSDYQLGDRVKISGTVRKTRQPWHKVRYTDAPPPINSNKTFTDGIIIGKRALQEGHVDYNFDEPTYFVRESDRPVITVYLVAFHLHRKPVMCRPDQLTKRTPQ